MFCLWNRWLFWCTDVRNCKFFCADFYFDELIASSLLLISFGLKFTLSHIEKVTCPSFQVYLLRIFFSFNSRDMPILDVKVCLVMWQKDRHCFHINSESLCHFYWAIETINIESSTNVDSCYCGYCMLFYF